MNSFKSYKENGYLLMTFSVNHALDPNVKKKDPVRVDVKIWGYILE